MPPAPVLLRQLGPFKQRVVQSLSSIAMSASSAPQTEVDVQSGEDIIGFLYILTQTTAGTLTGANTLDYAIENISVKDRKGNPILQNIRGRDLNEFEGLGSFWTNGKGIFTSVATTSSSNQTRVYYLPCRIDTRDQPVRYQVTIAPYSAMATSGATGGTVSFECVALYKDEAANDMTDRFLRLTQSVVSGTNRFAPNLPKGRIIANLAFTIGSESNLTSVIFSRDGSAEITDMSPNRFKALDQDLFVSGHQTGLFNLYNSDFVSSENTVLDVTAAGSDTVEWLIRISEPDPETIKQLLGK